MLKPRQVHALEKVHKIPCSDDQYFIIALDICSTMPTKKELEMLKSYREYLVKKMYQRPGAILCMALPAEAGHNSTVFLKGRDWSPNGRNGWCYRKISWRQGPRFIPCSETKNPCPPPWKLIQVLDHLETINKKISDKWLQWKKEHPKIFR